MILQELINKFFHTLGTYISGVVGPIWSYAYLIEWYLGAGLVVVVCLIAAVFLPYAWMRLTLGWIVSLAVVSAWVATVVFKHFKPSKVVSKRK